MRAARHCSCASSSLTLWFPSLSSAARRGAAADEPATHCASFRRWTVLRWSVQHGPGSTRWCVCRASLHAARARPCAPRPRSSHRARLPCHHVFAVGPSEVFQQAQYESYPFKSKLASVVATGPTAPADARSMSPESAESYSSSSPSVRTRAHNHARTPARRSAWRCPCYRRGVHLVLDTSRCRVNGCL